MDESRVADDQALQRPAAHRIPVRAISFTIVAAMVLYIGMATFADWDAFSQAIASIPTVLWVEVIGLSLLSYLLRFARWHRFMGSLDHHIRLRRNLEIYLSAFALTLTPGKAGEAVRSVYLHSYGVSYPQSIGAFVSERLLDLAAVGLLASLVVVIFPEHLLWVLGAVSCCVAVVVLLRSRLMSLVVGRLTKGSLGVYASKCISTIAFLLSGRRLAEAVPTSLLAWAAQGFSLYLIVDSLGYDLSPITVIAIYSLSILAGAASFIPGGLGATEAAIALLLVAAGVSQSDAITASLVSRGLTLWLAVGIGVFAMSKIAAKPCLTTERVSDVE